MEPTDRGGTLQDLFMWLLVGALAARLQDFGLTHADELLLLSLRPGH